jgi:hypothetical protein
VRRAAAALLARGLASCGTTERWVEPVGVEPPAGAEAAGKRAERQGGPDPDAGEEIFRLRPREGESIAYSVTVRNRTDEPISITGVKADEDRDGAFVPKAVAGAPVEVGPGAEQQLEIRGEVRGCRFGGQTVPLAGPELQMRSGGDELSHQVELGARIELVVQEGC